MEVALIHRASSSGDLAETCDRVAVDCRALNLLEDTFGPLDAKQMAQKDAELLPLS